MTVVDLEDLVADTSYYPYAALSCASFLTFYRKVSPAVSVKYFPIYGSLPPAKQVEWNTRAESKTVKFNCALVVGYILSDGMVMILHYRAVGNICNMFHHGATVYAFYYVMTYGALSWFANFRLIAEFSTPFVNQRWFLDVICYPRRSRLFLLNSFAMASTFFLSRIASIPLYWYKVYTVYGSVTCHQLGTLWYLLIFSCIVLDLINIWWFFKIFHGVRRTFRIHNDVLLFAIKTS